MLIVDLSHSVSRKASTRLSCIVIGTKIAEGKSVSLIVWDLCLLRSFYSVYVYYIVIENCLE